MNTVKYYESDIKINFLNYLRARRTINSRSIIASEYVLGSTGRRADLALHNGYNFIGVEVKSRYDTLVRLRDQLEVYTACFDDVMIVLDQRHIEEGLEIASTEVTVFEIDRGGEITLKREASTKPQLDLGARLQLFTIQGLKTLAGYDLKAPAKRSILLEHAAKLPEHVIADALSATFTKSFSSTSQHFWRHVGRNQITLDGLGLLSRFAPQRTSLREKQDERAKFWDMWTRDALSSLQETTA